MGYEIIFSTGRRFIPAVIAAAVSAREGAMEFLRPLSIHVYSYLMKIEKLSALIVILCVYKRRLQLVMTKYLSRSF